MKNGGDTAGGSIGFFGLLTLTFITLKIIGVIDWSWGIVLAPIWCPALAVLVLVVTIVIVKALEGRK